MFSDKCLAQYVTDIFQTDILAGSGRHTVNDRVIVEKLMHDHSSVNRE